jgi:hypothetical protein
MSAGSQNGYPPQAHLTDEWIGKYQAKSLAVEDLESASRHLNDCGTCRRVLLARMGPVRLPEELAEMPEDLHLSYEEIAGYIDGKLDAAGRDQVEAHTFICTTCSSEIADLRRLDAQLAAPVAAVRPEATRRSLGQRIAQLFQVPGMTRELILALGAIVAGIFLLLPAGPGRESGPYADTLTRLGADGRAGLHIGGYALVIGGVVYLLYRLWKRR